MEIGQLAQFSPEVVQALNANDLLTRVATSLGIDTEGLLKSEEQLAQEQEAAQQQMQEQQMMDMASDVVKPMAQNMTKPQ